MDMAALRSASAGSLRFTLKLGQNANANNGNIDNGTLVNGQPGNFQAVALPKLWISRRRARRTQGLTEAAPRTKTPSWERTATSSRSATAHDRDRQQGRADSAGGRQVQQPDAHRSASAIPSDDKQDPVNNGKCMNAASPSGFGVEIKAAFYFCPSSCQGGQSE
jgi:hypothetical protein